MDNPIDPQLTRKVERANKFITTAVSVASVFVFVSLVTIIGLLVGIQQGQDRNLAISRDLASQNHKRTQEYVKCVAQSLTIPVKDRSPGDIEACADNATRHTKDADKYGKEE
ncbi:hypothetical protein I8H89_00280 [Candidatus Saccharibacteria bacterium]|nr:hypothetical protein [Candidatus Saccharibacteria bacterium]